MKLAFFATLLIVFFKEHYVAATSRDKGSDQLEASFYQLDIPIDVKLHGYFPNLKSKAVEVTSACYQPLLNYNGTVVANIFEDDLLTVVKSYFKVNFQRLMGLSQEKVRERVKNLLANIAQLAESIYDCQRGESELKLQQQQCLTSFGDLSAEEKARIYLPKNMSLQDYDYGPESNSSKCRKELMYGEQVPPAVWDWRNLGIVTAARNQNPCGTCFIFSAVAAAESAWQRFKGGNTCDKFSEQAILNCIRNDPTKDPCETSYGGWPMEVFERMITFGATPLEEVPYHAKMEPCAGNYTAVAKLAGQCYYFSDHSKDKKEAGEELLQLMLFRNGPLAITIHVNSFFSNLCPGQVYEGPCTTEETGYHAVLLVGYDQKYWYLKNSYGGAGFWGDAGFFRMPRGSNLCHVGNGYAVPLFEL